MLGEWKCVGFRVCECAGMPAPLSRDLSTMIRTEGSESGTQEIRKVQRGLFSISAFLSSRDGSPDSGVFGTRRRGIHRERSQRSQKKRYRRVRTLPVLTLFLCVPCVLSRLLLSPYSRYSASWDSISRARISLPARRASFRASSAVFAASLARPSAACAAAIRMRTRASLGLISATFR